MMSHALRVIHEEHRALAAMLRSMDLLLQEHRRAGSMPDFGVLRAMLFYLDEFPERLHHTKESDLLFPKVRLRTPEAAAVLDKLDADHAQGERAIRNLEHALLAFEMMGESRREAFEKALHQYSEAYLSHMRVEEHSILPLAQEVLTADDWAELDHAFAANRDPMTGHAPDAPYQALFSRIVKTLPAPLGLGPPLE